MFRHVDMDLVMRYFLHVVNVPLTVGRHVFEPAAAAALFRRLFALPFGGAYDPENGRIRVFIFPGIAMGNPLSCFAAALLISGALAAFGVIPPTIRVLGSFVDDLKPSASI
jgi:hypothetical protein